MKNKEELEKKTGIKCISSIDGIKRFDICIQNPPYSRGTDALHLQFVDKCLEISDKQVAIFPFTFVTKKNIEKQDEYKKKFSNKLKSIEQVNSKVFKGTKMPDVAIYTFDNNITDNIEIIYSDGTKQNIESLIQMDIFSDYEKEIVKFLENQGRQQCKTGPYHLKRKYFKDLSSDEIEEKVYQETKNNADKKIPKDKIYLVCNSVNGGMNGKFFSSKVGQILNSFDDMIKYFASTDVGNPHTILMFNSVKEAENCKVALKNCVMRFLLYRLQQDQRMTVKRCYKYVPNIDWSDDMVKTDEGLLEVCGCPKDKCKEYADYCKKMINKVDNGEKV